MMMEHQEKSRELNESFNRHGMWKAAERPVNWGNPETELMDREFWRVLDACLNHLPAQQARVFMMRELIGIEAADICREAGITVSNLNVMLYRARMRLRQCLETRWFVPGATRC